MTHLAARCLSLPSDSEFFGVSVARVVGPRPDAVQLHAALRWCAAEKVACLYWLADATETNARLADHAGFRHAGDRVTVRRVLMGSEALDGSDARVRPCEPDDVAALKPIAAASHADSRFHRDAGFAVDRADALFETWLVHASAGAADAVFVAWDDARPVGYLCCHVRPGNRGEIGLFAVAESHRRKGFGNALVLRGLCYLAQRGVGEVTTILQGNEPAAAKLLESHAFTVTATQKWYHRWFTPAVVAA